MRFGVLTPSAREVPIFVLEVVSQRYRGGYSTKKQLYAEMGVLYYAVYSSRRRKKPPLEMYRLENGAYQSLTGDVIWMPELGLALGRDRGNYQGLTRERLYWFDENGNRYLTAEERADRKPSEPNKPNSSLPPYLNGCGSKASIRTVCRYG